MLEKIKRQPGHSSALVAVLITTDIFFSVVNAVDLSGFIGIASLAVASALFACLIILTRSMQIFFMFVPSFVISLIVSGDIVCAYMGLAHIPLGFMLALGIRHRLSRTQIIIRLSSIIAVFYAAALILTFILSAGTLSADSIRDIVTEQAGDIIDSYDLLRTRYSGNTAVGDGSPAGMSEADRSAYIESLKAIVPAFLVISCNVLSFFITFTFRILYNLIIVRTRQNASKEPKRRQKIHADDWKITMSPVSTVIFVICMVAVMIFSNTESVWATIVFSNVIYILSPALFIIGFSFVSKKIKSFFSDNYVSTALIFLFTAIIMVLLTSFAIMVFVLCGVYSVQSAEAKKLAEKIKKSFDDSDDE